MSARTTRASFEAQFIPEPMSGCWLWTGYSPNQRYGAIKVVGQRILAHVFSWMLYKGPVPEGKVIDHVCRNTFCVNPDHLEPITQLSNCRRSVPAIKTHCVHGHPYIDGVEIYARNDPHGIQYRRCLTCYRIKYPRTKK